MIRSHAPQIIKALANKAVKGAHNPANILLKKILPDLSAVEVTDDRKPEIDLSKLTDEQLTEYNALQQRQKDIIDNAQTGEKQGTP